MWCSGISISVFHTEDPGSIPGVGRHFFTLIFYVLKILRKVLIFLNYVN